MRALLYLTTAIAISWTGAAQASTEELLRGLMQTMNYTSQSMPAAERRAFAVAGVAYWKSFDSRIPRNSPADDAWLDGEMNTTDSERIGRMAMSPQFSLRELVQMSETCVQVHELLVEHIGADRATELYLWLKASHCYTRGDTVRQL